MAFAIDIMRDTFNLVLCQIFNLYRYVANFIYQTKGRCYGSNEDIVA